MSKAQHPNRIQKEIHNKKKRNIFLDNKSINVFISGRLFSGSSKESPKNDFCQRLVSPAAGMAGLPAHPHSGAHTHPHTCSHVAPREACHFEWPSATGRINYLSWRRLSLEFISEAKQRRCGGHGASLLNYSSSCLLLPSPLCLSPTLFCQLTTRATVSLLPQLRFLGKQIDDSGGKKGSWSDLFAG